jgi:hypothetical protein
MAGLVAHGPELMQCSFLLLKLAAFFVTWYMGFPRSEYVAASI